MTTVPPQQDSSASQEEVLAVLVAALGELDIAADDIAPHVRLRSELGLDSTEIVQVALELTAHCGVKVTLAAKDDLTVAEICALVAERLAEEPH